MEPLKCSYCTLPATEAIPVVNTDKGFRHLICINIQASPAELQQKISETQRDLRQVQDYTQAQAYTSGFNSSYGNPPLLQNQMLQNNYGDIRQESAYANFAENSMDPSTLQNMEVAMLQNIQLPVDEFSMMQQPGFNLTNGITVSDVISADPLGFGQYNLMNASSTSASRLCELCLHPEFPESKLINTMYGLRHQIICEDLAATNFDFSMPQLIQMPVDESSHLATESNFANDVNYMPQSFGHVALQNNDTHNNHGVQEPTLATLQQLHDLQAQLDNNTADSLRKLRQG